jgi:uncharacterized alkaline shock family protein YloU
MTESDTTTPTTTPATSSTSTPATAGRGESSGSLAVRDSRDSAGGVQGRTSIADAVVSKIAGIAAREIEGVHDLGGGTARAVGALRDRIPGSRTNLSQGVSVEVGERQAAVDLDLVAEFGVPIPDLATAVRSNVVDSVERMTGLEVTEVNITVHDVFVDDGSVTGESEQAPRVE